MKNIIIIGGGNQAQYVIDIVEKEGKYRIAGIIDSVKDIGEEVYGYKVIGKQDNLKELIERYQIYGYITAIGDNLNRYRVNHYIQYQYQSIKLVNAIHPTVPIGNNVTLGRGIVAMAGAIINPGAKIEDGVFLATGAQVEHDCIISSHASISAGTVLGGHVKLGILSALTLNVTVLDRIVIGDNVVVGAGSLVLKDIPNYVLAYGNPCKIIRERKLGEKFLK
jgi:sugar O-acyltransferase (sialic acid O-acetyltransferase NeuD family)